MLRSTCVQCGSQFEHDTRNRHRRFCGVPCYRVWWKANVAAKPRTVAERFEQFVVRNADGCWSWTGSTNDSGYGQLYAGVGSSHILKAHRVSYELHVAPIPDGMWVLHRCDNPPCTRPDHLFLGTVQDNVDDMIAKGRYVGALGSDYRGSKVVQAKLDEVRVAEILKRLGRGETTRALAEEMGVSISTIHLIKKRRIWRHVEAA